MKLPRIFKRARPGEGVPASPAAIVKASVSPGDPWRRWSTTRNEDLLSFYTGTVALCARLNAQNVTAQEIRLFKAKGATLPVDREKTGLYRRSKMRTLPVPKERLAWLKSGGAGVEVARKVAAFTENGEDVEEVIGHPAMALLDKPNEDDDGFLFWSQQLTYEEICGESFCYPVTDRGGVQLWSLHAQFVTPVLAESGELSGWLYGKTEPKVFIPKDELLHKRFEKSLFRPYVGDGPMRSAYWEAKMRASMTTQAVQLFDRGGRPDGHLSFKDSPSAEQVEQIRGQVETTFGSVDNWFRWLITGGGAEFHPIGWNPKELDYSQSRKDIASEIAGIFGVPESMLRLNDANLASATAGHAGYMRYTILPRCIKFQQWATSELLPLFGVKPGSMFFAVDNPVPQDEGANRLNIRADVQAGLLTINEGRQALGYDALGPEYDVPMVNGVPAGAKPVTEDPFAGLFKGGGRKASDADDHDLGAGAGGVVDEHAGKDSTDAAGQDSLLDNRGREGLATPPKRSADDNSDLRVTESGSCPPHSHRNLWLGTDGCCKALAEGAPSPLYPDPPAALEPAIAAFFARQRDAFIAAMQQSAGQLSRKRPAQKDEATEAKIREYLEKWGITETAAWTRILAEIVKPETDLRLVAAAVQGIRQINAMVAPESQMDPESFFISDERAAAFVDKYTAGLLDGLESVNRTTADAIAATLADGIREGEGLATLTNRVRVAFDDTVPTGETVSQYRAQQIARTETARAQTQGTLAGWAETGVVRGRKWLLAPNACEFCEAVAAKYADAPVPLGQVFYPRGTTLVGTDGGTMALDFTDIDGAPLHPNCRCAEVPVLEVDP